MNDFLHDLRYALRQLLRQRGFTLIALPILGITIGATTIVFSVVNGVLLRPLPFPEPERLVQVHEVEPNRNTGELIRDMHFAWQNYADIRSEAKSFQAITAYQYYDRTLTGAGTARRLSGRMITPDFFAVYGVLPALGRPFNSSDVVAGNERSALLSHAVWRDQFGADASIVGQRIELDGMAFTVAGVMPEGFAAPGEAELWMPLVPFLGDAGEGARRFHRYRVIGRLAAAATISEAQAQVDNLASRLEQAFPETNTRNGFAIVPLLESVAGGARPALRVLLGAVVLLLAIGCVNVAGLQLVHGATRERELAVRTALGAARARIARQLLSESLLLALMSGALGLLLASWGLHAFKTLVGDALPRAAFIRIDAIALAFGFGLTLLTGVLFGLLPALHYSRPTIASMLRGGRTIASERSLSRLRSALVITEIAVALVLATGSALLLRSFQRLNRVEGVDDPASLVTFDLSLPQARYSERAQAAQFYAEVIDRVRKLPQVSSAAATMVAPLAGTGWGNGLHIEGRPVAQNELPIVGYVVTTPGYFETTGVRLLEGRDFDATEASTRPAVIVNRTLARRQWQNESPLGKRVRFGADEAWATVIGVAEDVPAGLGATRADGVFVPPSIEMLRSMTLMVRVSGEQGTVMRDVRNLIAGLDRDVPVTRVATLEDQLAESIARPRYTTAIVTLFAVAALLLSGVGIYGVLAYAVAQRRRELGIRLAVGASARSVLTLVLRDGARLATIGVVVGLFGSTLATQLLESVLYQTSPLEPVTYLAAAIGTISVALLASWLPARRASRIDPARALLE